MSGAALKLRNTAERMRARTLLTPTGCWEWQGKLNRTGYGQTSLSDRTVLAHRAMYELARGAIPPGLTIDHLCRNRRCINPDHLEPVTLRENLRRSNGRGASNAPNTHCRHGHPFSGDNLHVWHGVRICRACRARNKKAYRARLRAKKGAA